MPITFTYNWDAAFTTTSISASSITNTSTATTAAINNDGKSTTEVSIQIAYGGTANEGVKVYLLRDTDGTNYEDTTDAPWAFMMPYAISVTRRRTFTVSAMMVSNFKIKLTNDSGATVTATVRYRQATVDQGS